MGGSYAAVAGEPATLWSARWFAARCRPNREALAAWHLRRQGYTVFLPLRRKFRRHARREDLVLRPFFPGYLFVSLDLTRDRWLSINGTVGVAALVMSGTKPAAAPVGIVEQLQDACDELGAVRWQPEIQPGDPIRIVSGAFANLIGVMDRMDASGRIRVLLEILGGRIPAVLPRESVVSAAE